MQKVRMAAIGRMSKTTVLLTGAPVINANKSNGTSDIIKLMELDQTLVIG